MRFLANENFPRPSTIILRNNGFEVTSIAEISPSISDKAVIELASADSLIILTFDRDYGEIIFRNQHVSPPAVVYFRIKGGTPVDAANLLIKIIRAGNITLDGSFTVIQQDGLRQRKY